MPSHSDKFKDECGVVAVYNNPEASTLAYLGLHALQHRGQESAGIISSDTHILHAHKAMGLVADIFTQPTLAKLPGVHAIGHTRYSTAGDSALLNAQPIMVDCNKGMIALAHNGNLVNANFIRNKLEQAGSIFQTTSDTEVVVHLIAQSKEQTLTEAIADALRRIEGAFSLVLMTRDRVFAVEEQRVGPQRAPAVQVGEPLRPVFAIGGEVDLGRAPVALLPARVQVGIGDLVGGNRVGGHGVLSPRA